MKGTKTLYTLIPMKYNKKLNLCDLLYESYINFKLSIVCMFCHRHKARKLF